MSRPGEPGSPKGRRPGTEDATTYPEARGARLRSDATSLPDAGKRFTAGTLLAERYRIVNLLGSGGMGDVYRADDLELDVSVALKFLPAGVEDDPHRLDALRDEVRVARRVSHANVCRLYDLGEAGGRRFVSMELIEGKDLREHLKSMGTVPPPRVVEIGRDVAAGLAAIHAEGVVHRDLKPANVLLDERGRARIADFGLARAAEVIDDPASGTPAYMSPEQIAGHEVTAKSDLYAFGLVLYELLTGERPRRTASPVPPSEEVAGVEPALERAIVECLASDPDAQPPAAEVATLLAEASASWRPVKGEEIPHRRHWQLVEPIGEGGFGEAWLAVHPKTREEHVFKFCFEASRLKALSREVTLFRLLQESLGHRDDIVRVLDWNLEEPPYFIESEHTEGGNLVEWAAGRGGLAAVPLELRLELLAQVADALAAAHSVGVLHKDVKPENVLVTETHVGGESHWRARLADFGIGAVLERERLDAAGITVAGMTETGEGSQSGTRLYMAPEVLEGKPATLRADVYALGVLLYQIVVGDFSRVLASGWDRDVGDEVLAGDIADFVDRLPERRPGSAQEVAERLRKLEERRLEREAERRRLEKAEAALQALEAVQRRRRLYKAVASVAVVALVVVSFFAFWAVRAQKRAERARQSTEAVLDYMVSLFDLIDPFAISDPDEERAETVTALEILDWGAERLQSELGEQPEARVRLLTTLGGIYCSLGLYDKSQNVLDEALEHSRKISGGESVLLATALDERGKLFWHQGDYPRAEESHRESLTMRRRLLGGEHLDVARSLNNLALVLNDEGEYAEAEELHRQALAMRRLLLGDEHLDVATSLNDLALVLDNKGEYTKARNLYREALEMFRLLLGEEHPDVATGLNNLALVLKAQGEYAEAEGLHHEALSMRRHLLGDEHPSVANSLNNLAQVLEAQGEYAKAEEIYREVLERLHYPLAGNHPNIAFSLNNLAFVLHRQGEYSEAVGFYREALEILRHLLGDGHPDVAIVLKNLAALLVDMGETSRAEERIREVISIFAQVLPAGHWELASARSILAAVLTAQGKHSDAEALLLASYPVVRDQKGEKSTQTRSVLERFVKLYEAWGKPQKASEYRTLWIEAGGEE